MEAGEYGLTRGTCFFCRLEVVAFVGMLWIQVVCFGWGVFFLVFFVRFFPSERTRSAARTRPPCLMYLSTSIGEVFSCSKIEPKSRGCGKTYVQRVHTTASVLILYSRCSIVMVHLLLVVTLLHKS